MAIQNISLRSLTPKPRARKPHIVPKFYLSRFHNPEGQIFVYTKDAEARRSVAAREAVERDFFDHNVGTESSADYVEDWLGRCESAAGPLFQALENRQQPTTSQRATWSIFVSLLFLRTRKVRQQIVSETFDKIRREYESEEHLRDLQHALFREGRLVPREELKEAAIRTTSQMRAQPAFLHTTTMERVGLNLARAVADKTWYTADAPESGFFVTSDAPVTTMALNGNRGEPGFGFARPNVAIFLPLSPTKLFIASPPSVGWPHILSRHDAATANLALVRFAHKTVFADRLDDRLKSLVDLEANKVVFGHNAFRRDDETTD